MVEAAQHGVPTIGYRSSKGLTDSIIDGVTGLLVDSPAELTAAVADLLADADRRRQLGNKARIRAGEFSWEATGEGVHEVLSVTTFGHTVSGLFPRADEPSMLADPLPERAASAAGQYQ